MRPKTIKITNFWPKKSLFAPVSLFVWFKSMYVRPSNGLWERIYQGSKVYSICKSLLDYCFFNENFWVILTTFFVYIICYSICNWFVVLSNMCRPFLTFRKLMTGQKVVAIYLRKTNKIYHATLFLAATVQYSRVGQFFRIWKYSVW